LALAGKSGAGILLDGKEDIADRLIKETGRSADVVMLCTSAMSAVKQAWNSVDKAGSVVFFAVPGPDKKVEIPINRFWTKEMRILTSYYCGPPDLKEAMELISSGDLAVEDLITHRIELEKIGDAFKLMTGGGKAVKIIIQPNGPIYNK
jgi:L-iditol 2-dehydrogenase